MRWMDHSHRNTNLQSSSWAALNMFFSAHGLGVSFPLRSPSMHLSAMGCWECTVCLPIEQSIPLTCWVLLHSTSIKTDQSQYLCHINLCCSSKMFVMWICIPAPLFRLLLKGRLWCVFLSRDVPLTVNWRPTLWILWHYWDSRMVIFYFYFYFQSYLYKYEINLIGV